MEITIENAPRVCKAGVKGVQNKILKKILQSDLGNSTLNVERANAYDKLG